MAATSSSYVENGSWKGMSENGSAFSFPSLFPWATSTVNHQNILTRVRPLVQSHVVFLTTTILWLSCLVIHQENILNSFRRQNANLISISYQPMTFLLEHLRNFQNLSQLYLSKKMISQEGAGFLMIDACPAATRQPRRATLKDSGEHIVDSVTSVSIIDWEHSCFTVQLGYAVVCILKERAKAWNYMVALDPAEKWEKGAGRLWAQRDSQTWRESKNSKKASSHILKSLPGEHSSSKRGHGSLMSWCSLC